MNTNTVDCERCGKQLNADTELWETSDELVCVQCWSALIMEEAVSLLQTAKTSANLGVAYGYRERALQLLTEATVSLKPKCAP